MTSNGSHPRKLFVYGTLRPSLGYGRLANGTNPRRATVEGRMYSLGAFPAVVPQEGERVVGEVIDFDAGTDEQWSKVLRELDYYEGVPHLYTRERTTVRLEDGTEEESWIYLFASLERLKEDMLVPTGDWADAMRRPA